MSEWLNQIRSMTDEQLWDAYKKEAPDNKTFEEVRMGTGKKGDVNFNIQDWLDGRYRSKEKGRSEITIGQHHYYRDQIDKEMIRRVRIMYEYFEEQENADVATPRGR